jgi:beta-glucanase (GH16 family)
MSKLSLLVLLASAGLSHAQSVQLARSYTGESFLSGFGECALLLHDPLERAQPSSPTRADDRARSFSPTLSPDFYTENDPTNGYVNYVSQSEASSANLVKTNSSYFTMSVDSTTASATGRGRNSVRLVSKDSFADGVYVLDVDHIPVGCGTWPAFWTTTRSGWPKWVPLSHHLWLRREHPD